MSKNKELPIRTNMSLAELRAFSRKFQIRPKRVFYSKKDRVVAILWSDKTQSKATCSKSDKFDLQMGIALCIAKRLVKPDIRQKLLENATLQCSKEPKKKSAEIEPDSYD